MPKAPSLRITKRGARAVKEAKHDEIRIFAVRGGFRYRRVTRNGRIRHSISETYRSRGDAYANALASFVRCPVVLVD